MGHRAILNMTDEHTNRHLAVCLWFVCLPVYLNVKLSACLLVFISQNEVYKTPCFVLLLTAPALLPSCPPVLLLTGLS